MARVYSYQKLKHKKKRGFKLRKKSLKFGMNRMLWTMGCFLLVFFLARLYVYQARSLDTLAKQKIELEAEIALIQEDTQRLNDELILLDELDYIEYIARTEYGMVAKGDLIFVPTRSNSQ